MQNKNATNHDSEDKELEPQSGIYEQQLDELALVMQPYMPTSPQPRAPLHHDQTATASNPRLHQRITTPANYAICIVHPGYMAENTKLYQARYGHLSDPKQALSQKDYDKLNSLTTEVHDELNRLNLQSLIDLANGKEGDYAIYRHKLASVFDYVRQSNSAPVIVYEGKISIDANYRPYPEYAAPDSAFTVATETGSPKVAGNIHYETDDGNYASEPQDIHALYKWLTDNGITTIFLAGEYGLSRGGGIRPACAGGIGQDLMDRGFSVHGIEGAVFPTRPADLPTMKPDATFAPLANALYRDVVALPKPGR